MVLMKIADFAVHGAQVIFGACVLGLSVVAIHWQRVGSIPATNGYGAFVGAFAILVGLIGLVAAFVTKLEKPALVADTLAAVMLVAGGIAYAVQLRNVDCGDFEGDWTSAKDWVHKNQLISGGCHKEDGYRRCGFDEHSDLGGRCTVAEANAAFLFLGFLAAMAGAVLCLLAMRKSRKSYGTRTTGV